MTRNQESLRKRNCIRKAPDTGKKNNASGNKSRNSKSKTDDNSGRIETQNATDALTQISLLSDQALHDSEEAISSRKKLTQRFLEEIEKEITEALKMLRLLGAPWKHGDRTEYEFMRISLDKALTARKKERRERLLQGWKDLLELRVKRLELLRENLALGTAKGNNTRDA